MVLSAFQSEREMPTLRVNFSNQDVSSDRNGLYMSKRVSGMLEGEDFEALNLVFQFVWTFVY